MIVYCKSLELVRLVHSLVLPTLRRSQPSLADQLSRAVSSVPLNIAEGSEQRGKRKGNHFAIALGSNREVDACLDVAVATGVLEPKAVAQVYALSDETQAMLYVLSHR